jgi:hypothetical protein
MIAAGDLGPVVYARALTHASPVDDSTTVLCEFTSGAQERTTPTGAQPVNVEPVSHSSCSFVTR